MNWVDVCGPPGCGKSTLCDPLWGPHAIEPDMGLPPAEWQDFFNEISRLMHLLRKHKSFVPLVRMCRRSAMKMSAVARNPEDKTYIQTGFAQRGLGIGWRLNDAGIDINELRHFFRLMPVSCGVVMLEADTKTVEQRNQDRLKVKETAHENRDYMVSLMQPGIEIATEVLSDRGIPFTCVSTEQPVESARHQLTDFADRNLVYAKTMGLDYKMAVLSPPLWW